MRRLPALALTLAAGFATLTACGSDTDDAATATSTSPTVSTVTVTAPASSTSDPAPEVTEEIEATEQETKAADTGSIGSDACAFATQDALLSALRASPDFDRVARPIGFRRIQCSTPFALASTSGTPQSSGIHFRRVGSKWVVLDVGSAIQCAQYGVTPSQGPALEGCVV